MSEVKDRQITNQVSPAIDENMELFQEIMETYDLETMLSVVSVEQVDFKRNMVYGTLSLPCAIESQWSFETAKGCEMKLLIIDEMSKKFVKNQKLTEDDINQILTQHSKNEGMAKRHVILCTEDKMGVVIIPADWYFTMVARELFP